MSAEVSPQQTIYQEFATAAARDWERGEVLYRIAGRTSEAEFEATDASGNVSYPEISGSALFKAVEALRASMAQPGTGAWFSARIDLTPEGGFAMDVDYDNEPAWDVPVVAETYLEEQELFPRDEENQPEWYRVKLREAAGS